MSKARIFAKNQVLEKALDSFRPTFRYGERLQMYNHVYKVISFQDKGYTFLEDEKNAKIAYPTNKLRMLMKKQLCRSLGVINTLTCMEPTAHVEKAQPASSATPKGSTSSSTQRGEPVGTVRPGKDGENYKKISANPSVWVRVSTGSVHHDPHGDEQDPLSVSHESRQQFHSMMSKIDSKVHPEDREKIQKKAEEWIQAHAKFKHMQTAHNTNEVDQKGRPLPKVGIPSSVMNNVYSQGDKARKIRQELIDMVKDSHRKLKGASDAK